MHINELKNSFDNFKKIKNSFSLTELIYNKDSKLIENETIIENSPIIKNLNVSEGNINLKNNIISEDFNDNSIKNSVETIKLKDISKQTILVLKSSPDIKHENINKSHFNNLLDNSSFNIENESKSLIEGVNLNKTFHLIKSKRKEKQLNSSLDIGIGDLGGFKCCNKLKKNYQVDLEASILRHNHVNHLPIDYYYNRSSSLPLESRNLNNKNLSKDNLNKTNDLKDNEKCKTSRIYSGNGCINIEDVKTSKVQSTGKLNESNKRNKYLHVNNQNNFFR